MKTFERKEGDTVTFKLGGEHNKIVTGKIRGCAVIEQALIGQGWIVELDNLLGNHYPFSCVLCFELWII